MQIEKPASGTYRKCGTYFLLPIPPRIMIRKCTPGVSSPGRDGLVKPFCGGHSLSLPLLPCPKATEAFPAFRARHVPCSGRTLRRGQDRRLRHQWLRTRHAGRGRSGSENAEPRARADAPGGKREAGRYALPRDITSGTTVRDTGVGGALPSMRWSSRSVASHPTPVMCCETLDSPINRLVFTSS